MPSIRREDLMAQSVQVEYEELFKGLLSVIAEAAIDADLTVKRKEGETIVVNDAAPDEIIRRLRELLGGRLPDVGRLRERLNAMLVGAQRSFLEDIIEDADRRTIRGIRDMSLPAREVFQARLHDLRELYLDSAVERINGESDWLKKSFLQKLVAFAEGETDTLNVTNLLEEMRRTSANRARFFARDQISRFNRSLMISTYRQAEAPYVEWLTCADERVRPEHVKRNHKIYTPAGLIADPEWQSYNCRCGFAPVYGKLGADQLRRLVA
jgi:SPP1 gp7 family putative phage head morphogenesis protein